MLYKLQQANAPFNYVIIDLDDIENNKNQKIEFAGANGDQNEIQIVSFDASGNPILPEGIFAADIKYLTLFAVPSTEISTETNTMTTQEDNVLFIDVYEVDEFNNLTLVSKQSEHLQDFQNYSVDEVVKLIQPLDVQIDLLTEQEAKRNLYDTQTSF